MALLGADGMSLPDGSMGCVLLGGIGFLTLCSPDLICLVLLVGLLCVGADGVFSVRALRDMLLPELGVAALVATLSDVPPPGSSPGPSWDGAPDSGVSLLLGSGSVLSVVFSGLYPLLSCSGVSLPLCELRLSSD